MRSVHERPARWLVVLAIVVSVFTALTVLEPRIRAAYDGWQELRADEATRAVEHFGDLSHVVFLAARSSSATGLMRGAPAARELIQKLSTVPAWYEGRGNAFYYSHLVLGRVALASGDVKTAKVELLEASKTPGSFGLSAYGPDMTLAQELLDKGEAQVVLEYLSACARFWPNGEKHMRQWSDSIAAGHQPDFGRLSGLPPRHGEI